MCHLVRGYFSLVQSSLCDIGQVSIRCLKESEPSIQLHGAKVALPPASVTAFTNVGTSYTHLQSTRRLCVLLFCMYVIYF